MIFKFSSVVISDARLAQAYVSGDLTVGEAAAVLQVSGFEVATPLGMEDRLGVCDIAPGDRIAVFTDESRRGDFPSAVRTGGREVVVNVAGREVSTAGRAALTFGVAHADQPAPDIDLQEAAYSERVGLLPGLCASLLFDGQIGQWFAVLSGGARVLLDDYELTQQPVPISAAHLLRFYLPGDDAMRQSPLAQVRLTVGGAAGGEGARLPAGSHLITVCFGGAYGPYTLRASDNVRVGQIAAGLARQISVDLTDAAYVMRLRVAASHLRVTALLPAEQLYVASMRGRDR